MHDSLNTILDDLYKLATRSVSLWNAQSKFVPAIGGKPVASLDPVLLEFDDVLLGFENQGQGFDFDFDFSEATAPGITVDNSVFDPRWMTS